jgi:3-deoxy-D-manno-octulosonate 8-phosphate phosphatase (KDO 8-P phosphatase)
MAKKKTRETKSLGARSAIRAARGIKLLLMDVDGVMTSGHICLLSFPGGEAHEMKVFHAHDGTALKLARIMGIRTGIITGRNSPATRRRAREAGIDLVFEGQATKLGAWEEALSQAGVGAAETAYIGDDLPDLPLLDRAGLAVAVANAVPEVKYAAHYVTEKSGGEGAVREVVELILKAQGRWKEAIPQSLA